MENNKPVFYMLVGLPASGKSSESDRLGAVIVRSSDYLRDKLCGDINDMKNNGAVFTILQSLVRADLYHGKDVVYDATNLKASYGTKKQSTFGGESEMIIQRGAYYRITKIEKSGYTTYIDMEVVLDKGYDKFQQRGAFKGLDR